MKHFDFVEFFYDAMNGMDYEQRGQFITVLSEYYFNGKKNFKGMDDTVIGAANMAINYIRKQDNKVVDQETFLNWSSEVRIWCKDAGLISDIKEGITTAEDIRNEFPHIPFEQLDKIVTWIKNKYDEKYYL